WIVDSTRRRLKQSSWSGLKDFTEDAANAYRLNLWSRQAHYIEFFVEKDAMAGILQPVTYEYDVHLNVIRGQVSETFVWNIAEEWKEIEKPILAYYLGDHDPSGLKIEVSLKSKLHHFTGKDFSWQRLAITEDDFKDKGLLGFPVKRSGSWREYLARHDDRCVEVDALPPDEIRERVKNPTKRKSKISKGKNSKKTNASKAKAGNKTPPALPAGHGLRNTNFSLVRRFRASCLVRGK